MKWQFVAKVRPDLECGTPDRQADEVRMDSQGRGKRQRRVRQSSERQMDGQTDVWGEDRDMEADTSRLSGAIEKGFICLVEMMDCRGWRLKGSVWFFRIGVGDILILCRKSHCKVRHVSFHCVTPLHRAIRIHQRLGWQPVTSPKSGLSALARQFPIDWMKTKWTLSSYYIRQSLCCCIVPVLACRTTERGPPWTHVFTLGTMVCWLESIMALCFCQILVGFWHFGQSSFNFSLTYKLLLTFFFMLGPSCTNTVYLSLWLSWVWSNLKMTSSS